MNRRLGSDGATSLGKAFQALAGVVVGHHSLGVLRTLMRAGLQLLTRQVLLRRRLVYHLIIQLGRVNAVPGQKLIIRPGVLLWELAAFVIAGCWVVEGLRWRTGAGASLRGRLGMGRKGVELRVLALARA